MKNDRARELCFAVYVSHAPVQEQTLNSLPREGDWGNTWTAVEQAVFLRVKCARLANITIQDVA